jgi:hypothetical protein
MGTTKCNNGRRKAGPGPINTTRGLGIRGALNSGMISTTEVEFPGTITPPKSNLRNKNSKRLSPGKRVDFENDPQSTPSGAGTRTSPRVTKTATTTHGPGRLIGKISPGKIPSKQVSPRTAAARAKRAEAYKQHMEEMAALADGDFGSPKQNTKISQRLGTGHTPPLPSEKAFTDCIPGVSLIKKFTGVATQTNTKTSTKTNTKTNSKTNAHGLLTPHDTPEKEKRGKQVTAIKNPDGTADGIHVEKLSEWLGHGPTPPGATLIEGEEAVKIPTDVLLEHMHHIKHNLRPLTMEELHIQFYLLQKMLRQFSKKFFSDAWSESRIADFDANFADLHDQHAPFFRMLSYIADGSDFQSGWADFLSSEYARPHIVYGVLGEWLKYNVFGHSCFGLSPEEDEQMYAIDVQYIKWDGFVRTKERAKLLKGILAGKPKWEFDADMSSAVGKVVNELMVVLAPVLPSCRSTLAEMKHKLTLLIDIAANLHLCIRLTGVDGTILRYHSTSKNDQFAYTARQNCVNKSSVRATLAAAMKKRNATNINDGRKTEDGSRLTDKLKIKMSCFPLVMAVVPYGPTLKDFAVEQAYYERIVKSPDLPSNNNADRPGPMYIEDIPAEIVRSACFEKLPDMARRDVGYRDHDDDEKHPRKKAFGSYVKQYVLNEADVYCEWDFPDEEPSPGHGLTLGQAVGAAYRAKYPYARAKKTALRATGSLVVAAVGVGAAYAIARHTPLGRAAVAAVKGLSLPSRISVADVRGAVKAAMEMAREKGGALGRVSRVNKAQLAGFARPYLKSAQARARGLAYVLEGGAGAAKRTVEKVGRLTEATTSVLKDAILPEGTVEPIGTAGLLSRLFPMPVGAHKTPVKVGIEIPKIFDPTSKVSKTTTAAAVAAKTTEVARTAAQRFMEYGARMIGEARGLVNRG